MADHAFHYSAQDDAGDPEVVGRYRILERMTAAQGFQGRLYKARDPKSGVVVAIKLLTHEYESFAASILASLVREQDMEDLRKEAQVLMRLRHPNIVEVLETGEDAAYGPYIVTEWVAGGSLRELLTREEGNGLPVDEALRIVTDVLAGLAAAHQAGIAHMDIKPENILLEAISGRAKLADFGIAAELGSAMAGRGTPGYMAPEQADASQGQQGGPSSDIYAVAVVLFEMLAGRLPRQKEDLHVIRPDVPPGAANAIARALRHEPNERFASAQEMARALQAT